MNTSVEYFRAYQAIRAAIVAKNEELDNLGQQMRALGLEIIRLENEASELARLGFAKFAEENPQ